MDLVHGGLGLVFVVGFALLVLLIGREIVCWYWKINAALDQLARLEQVLRNLDKNVCVLADHAEAAGTSDAAPPEAA